MISQIQGSNKAVNLIELYSTASEERPRSVIYKLSLSLYIYIHVCMLLFNQVGFPKMYSFH